MQQTIVLPQDAFESSDKTLAEKAYRLLREDIVAGRLAPGLKLKIEMLRDRYGLGAGPLREALARLSGDHLVTLLGQRGCIVAPLSAQDAREIGELRKQLEAEAIAQSLPRGDRAWEERLISAWYRLERLERSAEPRDLTEWEGLNTEFHEALVGAASSVWLLRMRSMMYKHHERYRQLSRSRPALSRDVHEEHRALFESAMDRDVPRAIEVTLAHIQRTTDRVVAALEAGGTAPTTP
ncbi:MULTISPECIES: GntR family transcriptional regulator [Gemmobacter]|jgi:DNA-binding GntR family transcriptional regulator|uniref:DNA-binding GntR family transcriptional regulator n=2 Tax=Gemmobacter TaxID=204456 RepID=A0A2T6B1J5_9RHOB|nr:MULTISPECIES: FCD domain-containing protein [Gemmobacter]OJY33284.1 MAG: transcriptional regulator [Rhodobacterales bacterium 65-51]PTX49941.1 DNA-binding GntR family transcriptional regulator [Gemmobacter caeni]TWJ01837.1 DNA-binding GntR family transcriptional regulator [Gemmobacter caeni]GHC40614.1 GntR family transcriptional regulator [Gemmobacter nanjingensis]